MSDIILKVRLEAALDAVSKPAASLAAKARRQRLLRRLKQELDAALAKE